jgi:hypothetical protein
MHYPAVYNHPLLGRFNIFTSQCIPALYISEKRMQKFLCQWMSTHILIKCNTITFHTSAELFQVVTNTGHNSTWGLT